MTEQALLAQITEQRKGTYILILQLIAPIGIKIGRLGTFDFQAGWYAYVGSAFGAGGLRGRLKHHLSAVNRPHWHVDYLRQNAVCKEIWYLASEITYEHDWAAALQSLPGAAIPAPGFGASDCHCKTHLIFFRDYPDFEGFCTLTKESIQRWKSSASIR
jgi:Uri superfamily endonuclease